MIVVLIHWRHRGGSVILIWLMLQPFSKTWHFKMDCLHTPWYQSDIFFIHYITAAAVIHAFSSFLHPVRWLKRRNIQSSVKPVCRISKGGWRLDSNIWGMVYLNRNDFFHTMQTIVSLLKIQTSLSSNGLCSSGTHEPALWPCFRNNKERRWKVWKIKEKPSPIDRITSSMLDLTSGLFVVFYSKYIP